MNTRLLAKAALRYLASLNMDKLPPNGDAFYARNERCYQALAELNNAGLGNTVEELKFLANQLTSVQVKKTIATLKKLDTAITDEYKKESGLSSIPSLWTNYYSGYESKPTSTCKRKLNVIRARLDRLSKKQAALFKTITEQQAEVYGYPVCGMMKEDFMLADDFT